MERNCGLERWFGGRWTGTALYRVEGHEGSCLMVTTHEGDSVVLISQGRSLTSLQTYPMMRCDGGLAQYVLCESPQSELKEAGKSANAVHGGGCEHGRDEAYRQDREWS